jgi:hypothetical protein
MTVLRAALLVAMLALSIPYVILLNVAYGLVLPDYANGFATALIVALLAASLRMLPRETRRNVACLALIVALAMAVSWHIVWYVIPISFLLSLVWLATPRLPRVESIARTSSMAFAIGIASWRISQLPVLAVQLMLSGHPDAPRLATNALVRMYPSDILVAFAALAPAVLILLLFSGRRITPDSRSHTFSESAMVVGAHDESADCRKNA